MEFTSYQLVSSESSSLNTGSYLSSNDYTLFVNGFSSDLWYGSSPNDVIEIGLFDRSQNFISWSIITQGNNYKTNTLSYVNYLNTPVTYSYSELISDFDLYKSEKILVNPINDVSSSFGILSGSFYLTYNFIRNMAGDMSNPLIIKEISPSQTEIKLLPVSASTVEYDAFCNKKVSFQDISPLYIQNLKTCQYGTIYNQISSQYQDEINTIKSLFFMNSDGQVINFIKNFYEDVLTYGIPKNNQGISIIGDSAVLTRIQGIKTYFFNYLLSNSNSVGDFTIIDNTFNTFVSASIEKKFSILPPNPPQNFIDAKQFIYDFFTKYFYQLISDNLNQTYNQKYYSYLKNALNLENNRLLTIIDHGNLDERINESDPLTLIIKLQSPLPNDVMAGTQCWISNISLSPYIVSAIFNNSNSDFTFKIGAPNFSISIPNVSATNNNKTYSINDLQADDETERELDVSRKLQELSVDYSNFQNFIVFSSAELRLKIFKNKVIQISNLNLSLDYLNSLNNSYLISSGSTYPHYNQESDNLNSELDKLTNSFDGYESYLYRSGNYSYNNGTFISSSIVSDNDTAAVEYDKNNRDSLIKNCPQYILSDSNYDEYLTFLAMVGQFFDEIFIYISYLPSQKSVGLGSGQEFTRKIVDYMLETFGWKVDDILDQENLINNYLNSNQIDGLNEMSSEDRLKTIRNRILINLPYILKTKGTQESIRLLLSCYGIPSNLLNIREYGGVNYSDETATYSDFEKSFMYQFNTSSVNNYIKIGLPSGHYTHLFKISMNNADIYPYNQEQILYASIQNGIDPTSISGSGQWAIGFSRDYQKNTGHIFFRIGYRGNEYIKLESDSFPLFDGNIYNVIIRRDLPDSNFEFETNINAVPAQYNLFVKRNESGRQVLNKSSSIVVYDQNAHNIFNGNSSYIQIGGFLGQNNQGFVGAIDKAQIWLEPVPDSNLEDYTNNINSYSFTGENPSYVSLLYRMHTDYPFNLQQITSSVPLSASQYLGITGSNSGWIGTWTNANGYYASGSEAKQILAGIVAPAPTEYAVIVNPPTGNQILTYNSASCQLVSQSVYPYQFNAIDYPNTYGISKYGPNKFRNEKVNYVSQSIATRFDTENRSTYNDKTNISPDSNQVGFFADPQDFKNKDIIRYFGNFDFMSLIGSPSNNFSSSYDELRSLRKVYADSKNDFSGSRILYNELNILYKLYFNNSIFQTIKNLIPARTNAFTGIIIEPTILERPKYTSKQICSNFNSGSAFYAATTAVKYFRDPDTKILKMSQKLDYAEFNIDLSQLTSSYFDTSSLITNRIFDLSISYLTLPNQDKPVNYLPNGTYISDLPDDYEMGHYGSNGALGLDQTYGKMPYNMLEKNHPTTSSAVYLLKRWKKYSIYSKTNEWVKTENPSDNLYNSSSIYLYDYIVVSPEWFNKNVYTSSVNNTDPSDIAIGSSNLFHHYQNTFKSTPNGTSNNYNLTPFFNGTRFIYVYPSIQFNTDEYFEVVSGYPRNHFTHKRNGFSLFRVNTYGLKNNAVSGSYLRSSQDITTTVGEDGLNDGSSPVQTTTVGNLNLFQSNNVINN